MALARQQVDGHAHAVMVRVPHQPVVAAKRGEVGGDDIVRLREIDAKPPGRHRHLLRALRLVRLRGERRLFSPGRQPRHAPQTRQRAACSRVGGRAVVRVDTRAKKWVSRRSARAPPGLQTEAPKVASGACPVPKPIKKEAFSGLTMERAKATLTPRRGKDGGALEVDELVGAAERAEHVSVPACHQSPRQPAPAELTRQRVELPDAVGILAHGVQVQVDNRELRLLRTGRKARRQDRLEDAHQGVLRLGF